MYQCLPAGAPKKPAPDRVKVGNTNRQRVPTKKERENKEKKKKREGCKIRIK